MKAVSRFHSRFLVVAISLLVLILGHSTLASAASWSTPATISAVMALGTPNTFATDPSGNQVWVTRATVTGGVAVQAAQRPAGGSWSALTNISAVLTSAINLTTAASSNGTAAAGWSTTTGVQIAQRSAQNVWSAPVSLALTGSIMSLHVKLDAQGNGVAAWTLLTNTAAVVQAVTWTGSGTFSGVTQLSSSSHGSFLPQLAVNASGTAVVVWQAAGQLDNSNPYQVESATRPAGGSWSAVTTVSPNAPQTWTPQVALDSAGNATAVWEQGATVNNYRIYSSTRPAGGAWSSQTRIEPGTWYYAGNDAIATDSAGNVTAAWLVEDSSGSSQIRAARKPAGGAWGAVSTLGPCTTSVSLCSTPQVAASPDGSLTAVGWAAYGSSNAPNVAVRLGTGAWTRTVLSTSNAQVVNTMASNSAHASTVWPEPAPGRHLVILKQSDYK